MFLQVTPKDPAVIVFTGGGTGGHVYPGIAVLQALQGAMPSGSCRFVWIGSETGIEKGIVTGLGLEYHAIATGKLRRYLDWKNLWDLFRVLAGCLQSRKLLKELRPAFLFSKGGFVSVPPVWAAKSLKIPVYSHESDLDPGLATRLNLRASRIIFCAYPESVSYFPEAIRERVMVTGNPVRRELLSGDPAWVRNTWNLPPGVKVVLVLGGSLGARQINQLVSEVLAKLPENVFVVHQTGKEWEPLPDGTRYISRPFFGTEMANLYAGADVIFGRAGAGTLWEAAATGVPLVLLPLGSGSRGDQGRNAALFASRGAARVLGPDDGPEALLEALRGFLDKADQRLRAREALAAFDADEAAWRIAAPLLASLGGGHV